MFGASPVDLETLYVACAPLAFRRARRLLGDEADAWDAVHEVFERLARDPGAVARAEHPMRYLQRATVNTCINRWKQRRARGRPLSLPDEASLEGPRIDTGSVMDARRVLEALWERLDDTGRAVLLMRYVDGLPQEEIADVLGIWRRTVGRRLDQIRKLATDLSMER